MRRIPAGRLSRRLRLEQLECRELLSVTFVDSGQVVEIWTPSALALGDLDGDSDLDAIVTTSTGRGRVLLNDGAGRYELTEQSLGHLSAEDVALADVDNDGDIDAVVAYPRGGQVWLNDGSATFTDSGHSYAFDDRVVLGDLDGDNDVDVWSDSRVWVNDGSGQFIPQQEIDAPGGHARGPEVALGDLDGDGDLDALVSNASLGEENTIWLNDGHATFREGQRVGNFRADTSTVALGDLDGDGDLDAVFYQLSGWTPTDVWLNDGNAELSPWQSLGGGALWSGQILLGDIDGDHDLDVVLDAHRARIHVWLNEGHGDFHLGHHLIGSPDAWPLALGDVDGDGDPDAILRDSGIRIWFNYGAGDADLDGQFNQFDIVQVQQAAKYLTGESATWSEGDWNGDGVFDQKDIVAAFTTGNYLQGPDATLVVKSEADPAVVDELLAAPSLE